MKSSTAETKSTPSPQTIEARTAITASLSSIGSHLDTSLQTRAQDIHSNTAVISKQQGDVAKQTAALAKQSAQYQKIADESREKLKEIGDVQNWAEMIERDLLVLEETMRIVEAEEGEGGKGKAKAKKKGWF